MACAPAYAFGVEPNWLELTLNRVKLPCRSLTSGVRILHLSDLHASPAVPFSLIEKSVQFGLEAKPDVMSYLHDVETFLDTWLPRFEAENRSYVTICIGCTGGRHRSVYLCERLAEHFRAERDQVLTFHRELD